MVLSLKSQLGWEQHGVGMPDGAMLGVLSRPCLHLATKPDLALFKHLLDTLQIMSFDFTSGMKDFIFTHFNSTKLKDSSFSSITGEELPELSSVKLRMQGSLSLETWLLSLADANSSFSSYRHPLPGGN